MGVVFNNVDINEETEMRLRIYDSDWGIDDKIGECKVSLFGMEENREIEFDKIVDDGFFSDATMQFTVRIVGRGGYGGGRRMDSGSSEEGEYDDDDDGGCPGSRRDGRRFL